MYWNAGRQPCFPRHMRVNRSSTRNRVGTSRLLGPWWAMVQVSLMKMKNIYRLVSSKLAHSFKASHTIHPSTFQAMLFALIRQITNSSAAFLASSLSSSSPSHYLPYHLHSTTLISQKEAPARLEWFCDSMYQVWLSARQYERGRKPRSGQRWSWWFRGGWESI